jgi:hypothetical protein
LGSMWAATILPAMPEKSPASASSAATRADQSFRLPDECAPMSCAVLTTHQCRRFLSAGVAQRIPMAGSHGTVWVPRRVAWQLSALFD